MVKYLKNYWLLFFALGCNKNENFVEGQIFKKKTIGLNKDIIEKYTTLSTTKLNLTDTNEIAHCGTQSVLKTSDDKFLLVDNINAKSFNISQIKIDSIENIKSFFYLKNELYVCTADVGELHIYKCEEKVDNQQKNENDDFLPIKEFSLTKQCEFNPNDNKNCFDKVKHSILRRLNKSISPASSSNPNNHYKLSQIGKVDTITFDSNSLISCCSDCVIRNNQVIKEGCFFILPCKLNVNCFSNSGGKTESVFINMGLFFDGKEIVPCLEGESDSSFLNGTFSDFSINAIKGVGNRIACKSMLRKNTSVTNTSDTSNDDFINVGELFLDSENNIRYRLIVSKRVDKLKDFTFLSTKNKEAIVSTVYVDESDNKVKFGRLIENDFSAQSVVGLQGIDLYKTKATMPTRTRLRDYNMVFIGNNNLLLQYNNPNGSDDCDYLLALNELEIPVCS